MTGFISGTTKSRGPESEPGGYDAGQRQRAMEPKVRESKPREVGPGLAT